MKTCTKRKLRIFINFCSLFIIKKLQRDKIRQNALLFSGYLLDIGSGRRPYKDYFTNCSNYVGIDISIDKLPNVVGSVLGLPFKDECFHTVICTEVLEHVPEPGNALAEIYRILKPNGIFYLTVPMSWNLHYEPHDYFRFTKYGLEYLLAERNCFEIEKIERIGGGFSLIGQRLCDILGRLVYRCFSRFSHKLGITLRLILTLPVSVFFWLIGRLLDGIDKSDAIGWVCIARKPNTGAKVFKSWGLS